MLKNIDVKCPLCEGYIRFNLHEFRCSTAKCMAKGTTMRELIRLEDRAGALNISCPKCGDYLELQGDFWFQCNRKGCGLYGSGLMEFTKSLRGDFLFFNWIEISANIEGRIGYQKDGPIKTSLIDALDVLNEVVNFQRDCSCYTSPTKEIENEAKPSE